MKYKISQYNADEATGWVVDAIARLLDAGQVAEVEVKRWRLRKTPPQHRTVWMWCAETASYLTEQCRANGLNTAWTKDDVYEVIFKPRFMPRREFVMPDGSEEDRPMGLSDPALTLPMLASAMDHFIAWAVSQGVELTIPEDPMLSAVTGE